MSGPALERATFTTNRASEYASEKELSKQIGGGRDDWPAIILRELLDNALDAAETTDTRPEIDVDVTADSVAVTDNGPGIPHAVIRQSIDYTTRTSDKNRYIAPTRGQLGNALKCLYPLPYLLGGGHVEIHSHGVCHAVRFEHDRIRDEPVVTLDTSPSEVRNGTRVRIVSAELACSLGGTGPAGSYTARLIQDRYEVFNPHATIRLAGEALQIEGAGLVRPKWRTSDPTSAHWYTADDFRQLVAGYVQHDPAMPLRALIATFDGLSGSAKARDIGETTGLTGATVSHLVTERRINRAADMLLYGLKVHARPVTAKRLGVIGREHFERMALCYGSTVCRYKRLEIDDAANPIVIELMFGYGIDDDPGQTILGVNFAPLIGAAPLRCVIDALSASMVSSRDPVNVFVHITAPRVHFADAGKTRLLLAPATEAAIETELRVLAKPWIKLARQRDREGRIADRALAAMMTPARRTTIKEAAYRVMAAAYAKASGDGRYPANARQIMYAARPEILALTGKDELQDVYFTQTLLPDFMAENAVLTASWDVAYDDRGHFTEPHTGRTFGLGTLAVRDYTGARADAAPEAATTPAGIDTHGPGLRYRAALFIEKEGFMPLIRTARIQERFDIAVMSTKGVSNTASRQLVEWLSARGVTVYVMHDFDKAGFTIAHTLASDTRRYRFNERPAVIDLGFRLADCAGLESEPVTYPSNVDPKRSIRAAGATAEEAAFLVDGGGPGRWRGRRVELNAMTSEQLVGWIEARLVDHGIGKFVPEGKTLRDAFERLLRRRLIDERTAAIRAEIEGWDYSDRVPADLDETLVRLLETRPAMSWDAALDALVSQTAPHP